MFLKALNKLLLPKGFADFLLLAARPLAADVIAVRVRLGRAPQPSGDRVVLGAPAVRHAFVTEQGLAGYEQSADETREGRPFIHC